MIDPELFKQLQLLGQAQSLRNQQASLKTQQEIAAALKAKAEQEEKDKRAAELRLKELERENEKLRRTPLEAPRPATPNGPQCPHCGGHLPLSAGGHLKTWAKCTHCKSDLLWHDGWPFENQQDIAAFVETKAAEAATAAAHQASQRAIEEKVRRAREDSERRDEERRNSLLDSVGLTSDEATFYLQTTEGLLTVSLYRQLSMRWAVWFAAGVQQRCWDSAQVFRIAHGHEIETGLFGGYKEGRITWSCFFFCTVKDIAIPAESEKLKESYFKRREQSHPWKLVVGRRPHIGGRESLCAMITDNDLSSDDFLIGYVPLPKNEETLGKLKAVRADQECRPKRSVSITTVRCHGGSGIAGPTASMDSRVQLGTCMYACALLVAADGRVTEKELQIVVGGLSWSGLESTELKQKFVEACKRVRQEGASKWSGIVTTTLAEETNGAQSGMPKSDLRKLLTRLVDSEPADSREKQELFNAIQAGFASSRSAAKPTRRVQNPWTGENQ